MGCLGHESLDKDGMVDQRDLFPEEMGEGMDVVFKGRNGGLIRHVE